MRSIMKICASAPVRICDFGGLTDTWFSTNGSVLNFCIDSRISIHLTLYPPIGLEMASYAFIDNKSYGKKNILRLTKGKECLKQILSTYHIAPSWNELIVSDVSNTDSLGCILQHYNLHNCTLHILIEADIMPGSSLGTSATFSVAFHAALWRLFNSGKIDRKMIVRESFDLEARLRGLETGIQDQIAATYGGINFIRIKEFCSLNVFPKYSALQINIHPSLRHEIEERMVLVYMDTPHNSSLIHKGIIANIKNNSECKAALDELKQLPINALRELYKAEKSHRLNSFGQIMTENTNWQIKLCGGYVSDGGLVIDSYRKAINLCKMKSTLGYKINGAGGDGGSISVLCKDPKNKWELINGLEKAGFLCRRISFSSLGLEVSEVKQIELEFNPSDVSLS